MTAEHRNGKAESTAFAPRIRATGVWKWIAAGPACAMAMSLLACGQAPGQAAGSDDAPPPGDDAFESEPQTPPPPSLKELGPDARRVKVIVLPGDASVEVDGVTAWRRDGVIELVGRVGETRKLRVRDGALQMEQDVKIEQTGASPDTLDLATLPPKRGIFPEDATESGPAPEPGSLLPEELE